MKGRIMKHSLRQYKKNLDADIISVQQFKVQIAYLTEVIARAEKQIPLLQREMDHYIKMLPAWKEDLSVQSKSLRLHKCFLERNQARYELAVKIDKKFRSLRVLERELQKK